jgi:hypothetical protein
MRGRTALLWALLAGVGAHLGLAIAIETWLPELRDPYYIGKSTRLHHRLQGCQLASRPADPALSIASAAGNCRPSPLTVVMLGSSRTAFGFKAGPLEEQLTQELGQPMVVFNFGIPAAGPMSQLLSLKRLLAEGIKPNLLLVEVLAPLLAGQDVVPAEARWMPADRLWLRDLDILESQGFPVEELRRAWWQTWATPWYTHRFAIVSRVAPAWLPWNLRQDWADGPDDSGWTEAVNPDPSPEGVRRAVDIAHRQYAAFLTDFRVGGPTCRAQRTLLELCRQEKIPIVLILMPEGSEFRSWYPPGAWEQIQTFLNDLNRDYGVSVINAREWIADGEFEDMHHLTNEGAEQFTDRLGRQALSPLLRSCGTP